MLTDLPLDSVRDRALLMRAMPTFAGVDDDSLALIAGHARTRVFQKGSVLCRSGHAIASVFAVVRGRVTATRQGQVVELPDPAPSMIGLLPVLARDPDGFDVVADEETVVLELPTQVVMDVLEEHFVVVRQVLRLATRALLERLRTLGDEQGKLGELLAALPEPVMTPRSSSLTESRVEMVLRLRQMPMFEHADLDALFAILDHRTDLVLAPGEALWNEGDAVDYSFLVDEGQLRCSMQSGVSVMVGVHTMLGRLEALSGEPSRYSVVAETAVRGQRLDMTGVMSVLESHFDVARNMLAGASGALLNLPAATLLERVKGEPREPRDPRAVADEAGSEEPRGRG